MNAIPFLFCAAAVLLAPHSLAEAPDHSALTAAVLDFQTSEDRKTLGSQVSTLLAAKLTTAENLILVERAELDKIHSEMELGLSGTVSPASAAKIGHLTGAKVLITGRVFGTDDKSTYIVAKIIGTETSRVYGEAVTFAAGAGLDVAVGQLADKIRASIKERGDTLVARVESPEAFIANIRKSIEGKVLPTVAIQIREAHLSRPIADPAAETEMKMILQKVGFEVLDPERAERKPDVTIKGEAFSELGSRRGNLISCKARVELQLVPRDPSKATSVERQTEVAVDLSENIAAKSALQGAGAKLAERVAMLLVR